MHSIVTPLCSYISLQTRTVQPTPEVVDPQKVELLHSHAPTPKKRHSRRAAPDSVRPAQQRSPPPADVVCSMDCDASLDPAELPFLTGHVLRGECELAIGAGIARRRT